ncbi:amidase [Leptolyngbya sp. BL0902]|uniref:SpoIID/LytB domain-containing protein n=1 Tax=Leptolyngbya sp. BL0902 TaxID=1115757 RepID=UPI0019377999|nr:SpoIID/LytB domain-containing protein [Leptolyngbya sp. BL0902]QQE66571.1 amidase [Leptolyngbya sp. BL0902]
MGKFDQHHGRFSGHRASWRQALPQRRRRWLGVASGLVGGITLSLGLGWGGAMQAAQNPVIQVGIVQRFGEELQDSLVIEALPGEQLTLRFETSGQPQTVTTTRVVVGVTPTALAEATLKERVVLSNHRSFESAEYSAHQWRERGIEPEIAQPGGWEIWANRAAYDSPLVRRLLVQNLRENGFNEVHLDSRVLSQIPRSYFEANGFRYHRDTLDLQSSGGTMRVIQAGETPVNRVYGGTLRLQPNTYGTYTLVNAVPMETYLRGVVPHEIGPGAPVPAIEAQAILARTYALRNLRRFEIDDYELCADTQCQVYRGLTGTAPVTDRAIVATSGQVLTYQNELVDALYSSTTGGVTAPFSDVWNGPDRPYLRSVVDSVTGAWDLTQRPLNNEENFRAFIGLNRGFNEETWRLFRWRNNSTLTEIAQELRTFLGRRQHPLAGLNRVTAVRVAERAASGRVQALEIETDIGVVRLEKDEIVRVLMAPRSLLFYVDPIYDTATAPTPSGPVLTGYSFVGGGWGHGVGLSQAGSYNLGNLGWSHSRILQFYYPGTTLQPFSDALILWRDPLTSSGAAPSP